MEQATGRDRSARPLGPQIAVGVAGSITAIALGRCIMGDASREGIFIELRYVYGLIALVGMCLLFQMFLLARLTQRK